MADYRIDVPQAVPQVSPVLQRNPIDALTQGISTGSEMGFNARKLAYLEEEKKAQAKKDLADAKRQEEKDTFEKIKFQSELLSQPYFKKLDSEHQNKIFGSYIGSLNKFLGTDFDESMPYHDSDSEVAKDLDQIFTSKHSMEDKRILVASRLMRAQQEGVPKEQLSEYKQISEMALKPESSSSQSLDMRKDNFNANMAEKMASTISGNVKVRSTLALNQQKKNAIEGAKALIDQVKTQPGGADQRQMFEIAASTMRSLIGNNMLTEGEIRAMIPNTYKGNLNKFLEKASNNPQGLDAKKFVDRFNDTLSREWDVADNQLNSARNELLGGFSKWAEMNPEYASPVLIQMGIYHDKLNPSPNKKENPFKIKKTETLKFSPEEEKLYQDWKSKQ